MLSSPAEALEPFRKYLEALAQLHLDSKLRAKLDPADIVQQTMLRACSAIGELNRREPEVLAAWLRRILANVLADAVRHFERDKRVVGLERSIEAELDRSASGLAGWLAADHTSPSAAAARNEELPRLITALSQLPDAMPEVLVVKHCQGWTLQRIADHTRRSVVVAAWVGGDARKVEVRQRGIRFRSCLNR
jgi:RNA polymerase sigma-70 factor, ECF subfamily